MTGVPRQKFEYLATFRFSGEEDVFEEIFQDDLQNINEEITNLNPVTGLDPEVPSQFQHKAKIQQRELRSQKQSVIEGIRRSLVFNVKQIDGPKVNFQYDTLNQYNRKRNVYRRVDYDPVSLRFLDTMDNSALKLFKFLYERNLKDGRNRSKAYGGDATYNKGVYQTTSLSDPSNFVREHNFGLDNSIFSSTYPIKSLDLFIVHGSRYNLIRFIHPKIISMDHDVMTYESSQPIEIGMQFAYETVIYETLNHEMSDARDVTINFDQIFENSLDMPETPNSVTAEVEGSTGTTSPEYDWTKLATSIPDEQSASTPGTGANVIDVGAFAHDIQSAGAAYGGKLQKISGTPFSDKIDEIVQEVYSTTKSAVSGFGAGGVSGGGQGNNTNFLGGLGDKLKSGFKGPGDGRWNPDSKNFRGNPSGNNKLIKDANGNVSREKGSNAPGGGAYSR